MTCDATATRSTSVSCMEIATAANCQPARELLLRIVSMLVNMGRALDA